MTPKSIFVSVVRTGKQTEHVEIPSGSSVEDALMKAGLAAADYNKWSITDEDGEKLALTSRLTNSTQLICGPKVDGAL